MVKTRDDSVIEIWSSEYINAAKHREEQDRNVTIIQIEHAYNNDYMVEFVRIPEEKEN